MDDSVSSNDPEVFNQVQNLMKSGKESLAQSKQQDLLAASFEKNEVGDFQDPYGNDVDLSNPDTMRAFTEFMKQKKAISQSNVKSQSSSAQSVPMSSTPLTSNAATTAMLVTSGFPMLNSIPKPNFQAPKHSNQALSHMSLATNQKMNDLSLHSSVLVPNPNVPASSLVISSQSQLASFTMAALRSSSTGANFISQVQNLIKDISGLELFILFKSFKRVPADLTDYAAVVGKSYASGKTEAIKEAYKKLANEAYQVLVKLQVPGRRSLNWDSILRTDAMQNALLLLRKNHAKVRMTDPAHAYSKAWFLVASLSEALVEIDMRIMTYLRVSQGNDAKIPFPKKTTYPIDNTLISEMNFEDFCRGTSWHDAMSTIILPDVRALLMHPEVKLGGSANEVAVAKRMHRVCAIAKIPVSNMNISLNVKSEFTKSYFMALNQIRSNLRTLKQQNLPNNVSGRVAVMRDARVIDLDDLSLPNDESVF